MDKLYLLSFLLITVIKTSCTKFVNPVIDNCPDRCSCQWIEAGLKVDCSNLGLTELPDFREIPVEMLDLSNNNLTDFPSELARIKTLKNLDLSKNSINFFELSLLGRFTSLKHLNLSYNSIKKIVRNTFTGRSGLIELNLSRNALSELPAVLDLESLQILDLSMCRLTTIQNTTFQELPELRILKLSGNRLTIPFRINYFKGNSNLKQISLGDNPWRCDCTDENLMQFFDYLTQKPAKITDKQDLKCGSPEAVYRYTWEHACYQPNLTSQTENIRNVVIISLVVLGTFIIIRNLRKKFCKNYKFSRSEGDLRKETGELHEVTTLEQEPQLNTSNPTEGSPPTYEDALLMRRLDQRFVSLNDHRT